MQELLWSSLPRGGMAAPRPVKTASLPLTKWGASSRAARTSFLCAALRKSVRWSRCLRKACSAQGHACVHMRAVWLAWLRHAPIGMVRHRLTCGRNLGGPFLKVIVAFEVGPEVVLTCLTAGRSNHHPVEGTLEIGRNKCSTSPLQCVVPKPEGGAYGKLGASALQHSPPMFVQAANSQVAQPARMGDPNTTECGPGSAAM